MYKFQSYFRQILGFYFCIFYGRGFRQGSTGLLPYPLPIVTVGESCSQPLGQLSFSSTSTSGLSNLRTPHQQRRGQPRGSSWELTWDVKGLGPGKEKEVKERKDSNTWPFSFPISLGSGGASASAQNRKTKPGDGGQIPRPLQEGPDQTVWSAQDPVWLPRDPKAAFPVTGQCAQ